jgi:multicomponent Na+:H+ antiporter subunit E
MKQFTWNLLLALAWVSVTGTFGLANFILGFALGFAAITLAEPGMLRGAYAVRAARLVLFAFFYAKEILVANMWMAYDIITPKLISRPAIIAVRLDDPSPGEVTLLANLITMTPGTLSLEVSSDRKVLYIHTMFVRDVEKFRRDIKRQLERRVLEVTR